MYEHNEKQQMEDSPERKEKQRLINSHIKILTFSGSLLLTDTKGFAF